MGRHDGIQQALFLERDGNAEIEYLGERDGITVAFKTALERQLNKGIEDGTAPSIALPPNLIPDEGELSENEIVQKLKLVQFRSQGGWLYIGWNHTPDNATGATTAVDTPAIKSN